MIISLFVTAVVVVVALIFYGALVTEVDSRTSDGLHTVLQSTTFLLYLEIALLFLAYSWNGKP